MKKPFVLIAAIVAVVGLGTAVAVAKETTNVGTSVKLEFRYRNAPAFLGSVKARNGHCQKGRRVIVTRDNERVYAGKSNDRGKYKIIVALRDIYGGYLFRAVANERTITKNNGDKIVCKRGRSKPWTSF